MDLKSGIWTFSLSLGLIIWLLMNTDRGNHNYGYFPSFYNQTNSHWVKPKEIGRIREVFKMPTSYINETDADQRLFNLLETGNLMNPYPTYQSYRTEEDLRLSGLPYANETLCKQQLDWIEDKLSGKRQFYKIGGQTGYEVTNLIDSFGKMESTLFQAGSFNWLGSYEYCLSITLNDNKIQTRYCIARYKLNSWSDSSVVYPAPRILIGICIPRTCDTILSNQFNSTITNLVKVGLPPNIGDALELSSVFCLPDEESTMRKLPLGGYILLSLMGSWLILVTALSIIKRRYLKEPGFMHANEISRHVDIERERETKPSLRDTFGLHRPNMSKCREILRGLTVSESLKTLRQRNFAVRYDIGEQKRVDLNLLDFFKSIMSIAIVLAHSLMLSIAMSRNIGAKKILARSVTAQLVISVGRFVDTFFVIFGLLVSYTLMRKFKRHHLGNPLIWIGMNIKTTLRIAPIFMITFWFNKLVVPYLGAGPWWDYGIENLSPRGLCMKDHWYRSIPQLGSIGSPPVPCCNPPSWFLVSYTQLSLILPLMTFVIYSLPNHFLRFLFIIFTLVMSCLDITIQLYKQQVVTAETISELGGFLVAMVEKYESTGYMDTLGRLGSVTIGLLLGYYLHLYEIKKIQDWPRWLKSRQTPRILLFVHVIMFTLPYIGSQINSYTGGVATKETFLIMNWLMYIIWPVANSLFILVGTTVYNNHRIVQLFSHPFWHSFNKLGLSIFMLHYEILTFGTSQSEYSPSHGSILEVFELGLFVISTTVFFSFIFYILFEAPMAHLADVITKPLFKQQQSPEIKGKAIEPNEPIETVN